MPLFLYKAKNLDHKIIKDYIFIGKIDDVYDVLKKKNLQLIHVSKPFVHHIFISNIDHYECLKEWFYCLTQILHNAIPLLEALKILLYQTKKIYFKKALCELIYNIEQGLSLSESCALNPRIFSPVIIQTLKIGEKTGDLESAFFKISSYLHWQIAFKQKIVNAVRYPLFLGIFFMMIMILLHIYFIPEVLQFLKSNNMESGSLDSWLWFYQNSFFIFTGIAMVAVSVFLFLQMAKKIWIPLYLFFWKMTSYLPLGTLSLEIQLTRFIQALALMVHSKIDFQSGFTQAMNDISLPHLKDELKKIESAIVKGKSLGKSFNQSQYIDPLVIRFVELSETSGALGENLKTCGDLLLTRINNKLEKIVGYLQPLLILMIGFMLVWILKVFLLPLYDYLPEVTGS